jgi:lipid-binding SYLF domain-containing protein
MSARNLSIILLAVFLTGLNPGFSYGQTGKQQSQTSREKLADGTLSRQDVMQIQKALKDREYNPGEINGMMSSDTHQAIREFQMLNGLTVTGNPDGATRAALGLSSSYVAPPVVSHSNEKSGTQQQRSKTELQTTEKHSDATADHSQVTKDSTSTKHYKHAAERAEKAAAVLQELTGAADKRVPNDLLARAEAIAVIPNMMKGALGIGGRYGKGLVSQRLENGRWSPPAFIEIGGGSFGAQIGVSSTDLVLVFTDAKALDLLAGGKDLKLGVDAGVVAGPIGREAEAGVNANLKTAIYAYSRSKGLFAGVALDGAVLDMDNSENKAVYGSASARQILDGQVAANASVRPFMDALEKTVPRKKIS